MDYVGGQEDLQNRVIRAIGDPFQRFDEDRLRMLRAIRFATTFDFALEPRTRAAIQQLSAEIVIVSAERIASEMRRILPTAHRRRGIELLSASRLLPVLLPELSVIDPESSGTSAVPRDERWSATLALLDQLHAPTFPVALAALIRARARDSVDTVAPAICERWRLSNDERDRVLWLLENVDAIGAARHLPWPRVQRLLVEEGIGELLTLAEGVARAENRSLDHVEYCREKLALPPTELNPPPLVNGDDLRAAGWKPGPRFREWLQAARDAQLEQRIATREDAMALIRGLAGE